MKLGEALLLAFIIGGGFFANPMVVQGQWTNGTNISNTNSGNVGIGTNNPQYGKLQVNKSIRIDDDSGSATGSDTLGTAPNLYLGTTTAGNLLQFNGSGGLDLWQCCSGGAWSRHVTFANNGNVGIGMTSPQSSLDVNGSLILRGNTSMANPASIGPVFNAGYYAGGSYAFFQGYNYSSSTYIQLDIDGAKTIINANSGGNVGIGTSSPGSQYKLDVNGNTNITGNINVTGNINAKYQDVAEWVPSSEQLAAGTVVVLDTTKSNQVTSSTTAYDTRVAGVISAQPGISLGEKSDSKVLVATTGRVRVKVDVSHGPIAIGDLLVTSDVPGVAMKLEPVEFAGRKMHMPGTIIGKALEPLANGRGKILVLLSLQ